MNLTGVIRCTKAILPHMRQARQGRIVNISSVGGLVGQPFNEIYCAAKFAVEGFTESLASYVEPEFGVKFTAIEPGGIKSEFANSVLRQFEEAGGMREDDYLPLLQRFIQGAQNRVGSDDYQTADEVAEIVADCLESADPPVRMRTSAWGEELCQLKTASDPTGEKLQQQIAKGLFS